MIRRLWQRFTAWIMDPMTVEEAEALQRAKEQAEAFQYDWRKSANMSDQRKDPEPPISTLDV